MLRRNDDALHFYYFCKIGVKAKAEVRRHVCWQVLPRQNKRCKLALIHRQWTHLCYTSALRPSNQVSKNRERTSGRTKEEGSFSLEWTECHMYWTLKCDNVGTKFNNINNNIGVQPTNNIILLCLCMAQLFVFQYYYPQF